MFGGIFKYLILDSYFHRSTEDWLGCQLCMMNRVNVWVYSCLNLNSGTSPSPKAGLLGYFLLESTGMGRQLLSVVAQSI